MLSTIALSLTLATGAIPTLRVRVDGPGYLSFAHQGRLAYVASANLTAMDGLLSHENGATMIPTIRVPRDAIKIEIDESGVVFATMPTFRARAGRLTLSVFRTGSELRPFGEMIVSPDSPRIADPGEAGAGSIRMDDGIVLASPKAPEIPEGDWFTPLTSPRTFEPLDTTPPTIHIGTAKLEVRESVESDNDRVTLGELADIQADETIADVLDRLEIADTPVIGKSRTVDRRQIERALSEAGFEKGRISIAIRRRVTLKRRSQRLSPNDFSEVALQAARKMFDERAPLKARVKDEAILAPAGDVHLEAESCVKTKDGAAVIVVTKVDGERFNSRVVRVKIDSNAPLPR